MLLHAHAVFPQGGQYGIFCQGGKAYGGEFPFHFGAGVVAYALHQPAAPCRGVEANTRGGQYADEYLQEACYGFF